MLQKHLSPSAYLEVVGLLHDKAKAQQPWHAFKGDLILLEVGLVHGQPHGAHTGDGTPERGIADSGVGMGVLRLVHDDGLVFVEAKIGVPVKVTAWG